MAAKGKGQTPSSPGPGVDATGRPVMDPTPNVLDLVRAESRRQDDLREMQAEHFAELLDIRERYQDKLDAKETSRLDSIRTVDIAAGQRAQEVSAEAVKALAAQVPVIAEAVRQAQAIAITPLTTAIQELQRAQYELQGQKQAVVETKSDAAELANILAPMVENLRLLNAAQEQKVGGQAATVTTTEVRRYNQSQIFALIGGAAALSGIIGFIIK